MCVNCEVVDWCIYASSYTSESSIMELITCSTLKLYRILMTHSLSARILHRAPPPPAPSGPKFSNSKNCCGSENAMPPKIFWDMEGHRGHFR